MLNKIIELSNLSGNEKIEFMKKHPELKQILYYTYNPFLRYYMKAPVDSYGSDDPMAVDYIPYDFLNDVAERIMTGNASYSKMCDWIRSMNYETGEIFKLIVNKDIRAGVNIKSINTAFPGLIPLAFDGADKPPVMLLRNYKPGRGTFPCLAAVKKDGVRGLYHKRLLSRQGKPLYGMDHIEKELQQYGVMLDGEIVVPGLEFDEASGRIRDKEPTPEAVIWLFDAPSIYGSKLDRYRWLRDNINESDCVKIITHYQMNDRDQLMRFYNHCVAKGEEGIVRYETLSSYEDHRSIDWMRLVPIKSADCPVIGFYEGKGKLENNLGGIIIDYKGIEVKVGTGFAEKLNKTELNQLVTDFEKSLSTSLSKNLLGYSIRDINLSLLKLRKVIWGNQEAFLGAIAKVEFKGETKKGSLRQPRFKTWRLDKM